ncbi:unnamed protein product [Pelagomonas calceolata]|uniref:Thioredoxin domain-containing protein n=1 Tax=Pelagomonas calceolata TaxID=35677 RepID=A0A8J2SIQ6_9STRA|nr:unnamed protein product [Pelagomonas calceolata]
MLRRQVWAAVLLAASSGGFIGSRPAPTRSSPRRFAEPKRKPGQRGSARAKERLRKALEKEGAPPPRKDPLPTTTTTTIPSRVELRRRAGLPPLEPLLRRAPADLTEASVPSAPNALEIPARWQKVPDCERPNKWRELMDDEDCKFEKQQKKLLGEGKKINDPYVEIIPQLKTLDDFLKANAHAQSREKALVVKFYSRQCRACLRIAAKYRRLALEKRDEIDCYEVESLASRPLVDGLNVTKVPSVQIYDPDGVTRLADGPCMPDDFPRLERKVDVVIRSMQKRRSAHKVVARSYAAELCHMRSKDCAPSPSSVSRMSEEEFEAFEAAVCAICPPQGRFGSALRTKESAAADPEWPRPVSDDD